MVRIHGFFGQIFPRKCKFCLISADKMRGTPKCCVQIGLPFSPFGPLDSSARAYPKSLAQLEVCQQTGEDRETEDFTGDSAWSDTKGRGEIVRVPADLNFCGSRTEVSSPALTHSLLLCNASVLFRCCC